MSSAASRTEGSTPQRVLVVGGGPAGLVTLRNMVERGRFAHVELYERRDDIGGVWYYEEPQGTKDAPDTSVPRWPSPAYPGLIGNVLPEFLSFSEFPFPEPESAPLQPFPTLMETHTYLQAFAEPYMRSGTIKLNREVVAAVELEDQKGWRVTSRDWTREGKETEEHWDAIIVAIGWYDHPRWPSTEGLSDLRAAGLAHHAKSWRGLREYSGKKALVIGNANSSNDIAAQLAPISSDPVYQSIRRTAFPVFPSLPNPRIQMVAPVARYALRPENRQKFDAFLTDGTTLSGLDVVHVGAGYRILPSFVRVAQPDGLPVPLPDTSESADPRVPGLHRLILHAGSPTLGFIGAPLAHTPFTIADIASTWLALAWRGEVAYPATSAGRLEWEKERLEHIAHVRRAMSAPSSLIAFSVLASAEEGYAASLRRDVIEARPELDPVLPVWNEEQTEKRVAMYGTKFEALERAATG